MIKLDKIYTRGGDSGITSLGDGSRVPKNNPRVAAYGSIDEANAIIGVVRLETSGELDLMLSRIQNDLFDVGADLCLPFTPDKSKGLRVSEQQVLRLEEDIDRLNGQLEPLSTFILPGGSTSSAYLHLARTVVRRAEREICEFLTNEVSGKQILIYVNRLSDFLFVVARRENNCGRADILWVPGRHQ